MCGFRLHTAASALLAPSFLIAGALQRSGFAEALAERSEKHDIFWRQLLVAKKLSARGDKSRLRRLEPWLMHEDRHLRDNSALVLARLGDDRCFQAIAEVLNDRSIRKGGRGMPRGPWTLRRQISADRYYAVHLLGLLKDRRAVAPLAPLLDDEDLNYKNPRAVGEIGGEEAMRTVLGTPNKPSVEVRCWSVESLGRMNAREALPQLRWLLDDHAQSHLADTITVAEAARRAIEKIERRR